ncbi:MAG: 3-phosphoserine/phosphohydroxythreonine transaminase [Chromatiales bacterium]|nr:3-phosphoserine/phosphohydroxythreonine transaminase [Chromatiales bacterium]
MPKTEMRISDAHQLYNFSPGPATLPEVVLQKSQQLVSAKHPVALLEISHRSAYVDDVIERMQYTLRDMLSIPDDYEILFASGGSRAQYAALAMNLGYAKSADYFDTGYWSRYATSEAQKYIEKNKLSIITSITDEPPLSLPATDEWQLNEDAAYRHYVSNETFIGFEFCAADYIRDGTLVADMTSNFLTDTIDVKAHKMIYAGAQKNAGVSGLVYIIVRRDVLAEARHPLTPALYDYDKLLATGSRPTTPPVFSWLVAQLMLEWIVQQGGVQEMQQRCHHRSTMLYDCIDRSSFYTNPISPAYRSRVNIFFNLPTVALEQKFIVAAEAQGLWGLKGHSQTGGIRASLYNGMPISGAETLVEFMKDFERMAG